MTQARHYDEIDYYWSEVLIKNSELFKYYDDLLRSEKLGVIVGERHGAKGCDVLSTDVGHQFQNDQNIFSTPEPEFNLDAAERLDDLNLTPRQLEALKKHSDGKANNADKCMVYRIRKKHRDMPDEETDEKG